MTLLSERYESSRSLRFSPVRIGDFRKDYKEELQKEHDHEVQ